MITLKGAKHAFILFDFQVFDEEAEEYMKNNNKIYKRKFVIKNRKQKSE